MKRRLSAILLLLTAMIATADNASAYYSTGLGRFITRDPIGYDTEDMNLYEYVGGRPLVLVDPSGWVPNGGDVFTSPGGSADISPFVNGIFNTITTGFTAVVNGFLNAAVPVTLTGGSASCGKTCGVTMQDHGGRPISDLDLGAVIGNGNITKGVGSQDDILNALNKGGGCCTLYLIGHRGGNTNLGGIVTYPIGSDGKEITNKILPDPVFEGKLKNNFKQNGCTDCVINIVACSLGEDPVKEQQNRQQIANNTGCTVCGSTGSVRYSNPRNSPVYNPPTSLVRGQPNSWSPVCVPPNNKQTSCKGKP